MRQHALLLLLRIRVIAFVSLTLTNHEQYVRLMGRRAAHLATPLSLEILVCTTSGALRVMKHDRHWHVFTSRHGIELRPSFGVAGLPIWDLCL